MKLTTLCYIENDERYLMLHRTVKKVDSNKGKWIGVGGKFEKDESPEECIIREVKEETGFSLTKFRYRGIVTFVSDEWETEYMHLFTADGFDSSGITVSGSNDRYTAPLPECNEGELEWIPKKEVFNYNMWEGDRIFLKLLMETDEFFSLKFEYRGEELFRVKKSGITVEKAVLLNRQQRPSENS